MNTMLSTELLYPYFINHPCVVTDSRKIQKNCLFFALKGDNFDGNAFALQAIADGAAYAVIDDTALAGHEKCLLVQDVLQALQHLATHHRQQFEIPFIAITGSNGKTTTKELVSAVLSTHYRTHFTQGNLNNHIGVPLTLLSMHEDAEVAVIEMGANHQGEIDFLCRIAQPTHGLITNVGKAHLEGFGGIEGVKKGKSELYRYLASTNGMIFINEGDPVLMELAAHNPRKIGYIQSEYPNPLHKPIEIRLEGLDPFVRVSFLSEKGEIINVDSQLIGEYNFNNIMTAIALGRYFKVPAAKIKNAIEQYIPSNNRSQIIEAGSNRFILDAYNANPSSMRLALSSFSHLPALHKVAILGDMFELGAESASEHAGILQYALTLGFDQVILVGPEFGRLAGTGSLLHFQNINALKTWFGKQSYDQTLFLVKGSRGMSLEKLL